MNVCNQILPSEKYRNQHGLNAASKVHISKKAMVYSDKSTSSPFCNIFSSPEVERENEKSHRRIESHHIWHKLKNSTFKETPCLDNLTWMGTGLLGRFYVGSSADIF